jgi:hypothetical protein
MKSVAQEAIMSTAGICKICLARIGSLAGPVCGYFLVQGKMTQD